MGKFCNFGITYFFAQVYKGHINEMQSWNLVCDFHAVWMSATLVSAYYQETHIALCRRILSHENGKVTKAMRLKEGEIGTNGLERGKLLGTFRYVCD